MAKRNEAKTSKTGEATSMAKPRRRKKSNAIFTVTVSQCWSEVKGGQTWVYWNLLADGPGCVAAEMQTRFGLETLRDVEFLMREMAAFGVELHHARELDRKLDALEGRSLALSALPGFTGVCADLAPSFKQWKPSEMQIWHRERFYGFRLPGELIELERPKAMPPSPDMDPEEARRLLQKQMSV